MIEIERVSRLFGDLAAVDAVSLAVARGPGTDPVGPSGCAHSVWPRATHRPIAPTTGPLASPQRATQTAP
ncbi:amino acid ABC transporter ATP-binding protein, partial [Burkholderia pseudomallei]